MLNVDNAGAVVRWGQINQILDIFKDVLGHSPGPYAKCEGRICDKYNGENRNTMELVT
jgi:hypothetical protein